MPNPVIRSDLEVRFRPLTGHEVDNAQALLDDAWAELLVRVPDLEARQAAGDLPDAVIVRVVAAMVVRVLRNPDAIRQWAVDDATFVRDNTASAGALYVTPDELALLGATPTATGDVVHLSISAPYR